MNQYFTILLSIVVIIGVIAFILTSKIAKNQKKQIGELDESPAKPVQERPYVLNPVVLTYVLASVLIAFVIISLIFKYKV